MLPLGPTGFGGVALPVALVVRRQPPPDQAPRGWSSGGWLDPQELDKVPPHRTRITRGFRCGCPTEICHYSTGRSKRFQGGSRPRVRGVPRSESFLAGRLRPLPGRAGTPTTARPWFEWEPELLTRDPGGLRHDRGRPGRGHPLPEFVQYVFETQWRALRAAWRRSTSC